MEKEKRKKEREGVKWEIKRRTRLETKKEKKRWWRRARRERGEVVEYDEKMKMKLGKIKKRKKKKERRKEEVENSQKCVLLA